MTDRELFKMALDALEHFKDEYGWGMKQKKAYRNLQIRLEAPPKDLELPLVRPEEFVLLIQGKENFRGKPAMRTEWPTETGAYEMQKPPQPEPMIDGWPLYSGLPQLEPESIGQHEFIDTTAKWGRDLSLIHI